MNPWYRAVIASAGVALATLALDVSSAAAQGQRPSRPYRGLFAGGTDNAEQSLVATASLGSGYDTNVLAAALGRDRVGYPGQAGAYVHWSTGLSYNLSLDRVQVGASVGNSAQYFPKYSEEPLYAHGASVGINAVLLRKPTLTVNQSVSYQPFTFLGAIYDYDTDPPLLGQSAPPDVSYAPTVEHYLSYTGGLALAHDISRRASLSTSYQYRQANRASGTFFTQAIQASLRVGLSQYSSLRVGYGVREGRYWDGRTYRNHTPLIGVDYARPLSLTRRTYFSFGAGATAVNGGNNTQVRATGNASLTHEIGRSWQAYAAYARGLRYVETFDQPVFNDSVTVGFGGLINNRVQVSTFAAMARGEVGFSGDNSYDSVSAGAAMAMALNRFSNVTVSYSRYRYNYGQDINLPPDIANRFGRQGVRASINFWAPIFTKRRRP